MTALILLALGLGGLAAGILVGRYYVPDDRALRRSARHATSYIKTINFLLARDRDAAVEELVAVVADNVNDVEPYFALGALFRNRGEWERAIRVHQAIELRSKENRKLRLRARYQLGLDFRAAGMPRRATQAMEDCLEDNPKLVGALLALCGLYEEQGRFAEAASSWHKIGRLSEQGDPQREHHLLCAAAQRAIENDDTSSAKQLLKDAQAIDASSPHLAVASAELAAASGNWKRASSRLLDALALDPALVRYLAGPLCAAELELQSKKSLGEGRKQEATRGAIARLDALGAEAGGQPLLALAAAEMRAEVNDGDASDSLELLTKENPDLLPARVAAARLALESQDASRISQELSALVGGDGVLESVLEAAWRCAHCQHSSEFFFWRCESCRRWGNARPDTGQSRAPQARRRERRQDHRAAGLLLSGDALPQSRLEAGMSESELARSGQRKSTLGRWLSGAISTVRGNDSD